MRTHGTASGDEVLAWRDARTGVVPFASTRAETIAAEGSRDDVTFGETQARAAREAAGRALPGIAQDLSAFPARAS